MWTNNFRFQLIIRSLGIALASTGLAWAWLYTDFLITPIAFGLLVLLQTVFLIVYCESTFREMSNFFSAFEDKDYTRKFSFKKQGRAFVEISSQFNRIMSRFQQLAVEKEQHYQYLLRVFEHVDIALISFTSQGKISLMNQEACELLERPRLPHIRALAALSEPLHDEIREIRSGEHKLLKVPLHGRNRSLALAAQHFKLGKEYYTLISIQDIQNELDANEMQAWQKLIRVLTHEIMNSVTPLVSLTTAVKMMVEESPGQALPAEAIDEETMHDIYRSLSAIENRNKGLLSFINAYRDYTKVPEPHLEEVTMSTFVENLQPLLRQSIATNPVTLHYETEEMPATATFDAKLIEQVIINLVKNAAEAIGEDPEGEIRIAFAKKPFTISITDNGPGIAREQMEQIFVPFYTTKLGGNGIGLSLSRSIMKAHQGQLQLQSAPGKGSRFTLGFGVQRKF